MTMTTLRSSDVDDDSMRRQSASASASDPLVRMLEPRLRRNPQPVQARS